MTTATYDPKEVTVDFGGLIITGYADSSFIEADKAEDAWSTKVGADGAVTRTQNRNATGKVTLTLMAESDSNRRLDAIHRSDIKFKDGIKPLNISDSNSVAFAEADEAWIVRVPKLDRGKESGDVQWVFECADLDIHQGGAAPTT